MANVKVAIRVRPLNSRESVDGGRIAVQVEDKVVRVRNVKLDGRLDGRVEAPGDSRERLLEFGFDYCYWSVNPEAPNYASQEEVFHDLGVSVLAGAAEGYNICLFAYGQTGSGKTYTMMGTPDSTGLTPRICQGLFQSDMDSPDGQNCRVEISFLEIYNERVRDLLRGNDQKKPAPLRVREHPEKGPYVQGLSQHVVSDYKQAEHLLKEGISNRITAATHVHDASSRSHAIFSIQYTQAILENNLPSEIVSKINLVDLAGSERADPQYCRDRITEGANINKSLVTLGIVISALAQNSQMCSSSQSINSMLSEGEGSTVGSHSSSLSSSGRRHCFIPYRDSVLTWLLKDSLGGNSKTIMIATISPSYSSYNETLSTLRYAAHARNIVNKPRVNEDANVRLIRELREEIDRLKSMLLNFSMRNPSPSLSDERDGSFSDIVLQNEIKVEQLTKDWSDSWRHKRSLLEEYSVDINENRAGVQIHSLLPHLISLEPDVLSTGVTIYHLREGVTRIGPQDQNEEEPHIVLSEGSACEIENQNGVVTLRPLPHSICMVNDREVTEACRLAQGAVIMVGGLNKFRFNHPAEAAVLRERRRTSEAGLLCDSSFSTFSRTVGAGGLDLSDGPAYRQRLEEQQHYVECLWEKIQVEQRRAEKDLEREQAHLRQQHTEIQQWILQEKQRLAAIRERGTLESGVQTDLIPLPVLAGGNQNSLDEGDAETVGPSLIVGVGKQVVQEELLKHHALRRAENRIRRKRLHYQLERIACKRHLLEAKRELQRLENTLSFGADGPSSPELGSPSKCRGHPLALRRHSFSADLLSRLYPQHTSIFRQFLRRNRSSESTSSLSEFTCPRKWVSDEFLPDQKTRGRSNTMPSRYSQGTSSRMGSSENLKTLPKDDVPSGGMTERKTLASNPESSVWNPTGNHNISSQSAQDSNNSDTKKVLPIIKQSSTQKASAKGGKTFAHGRSKGLETIRKALSRSVGSGIKTALSRVFRKPPLGLRGGRGTKTSNKAKAQFVGEGNKDKVVGNMETKQQKCCIKTTVSCEGLEHLTSIKDKAQRQRRWHSAEALTNKTKKWVRMQQELTGCVENDEEEEIDGSSDCDSLFSVDSLSSAYAIALAEQLQQEECEPSEAESEDSQMSKDSLVMESSGKHITAWPALKPSYSLSHSFHTSSSLQSTIAKEKIQKSKEIPAEVFWKIDDNPKPERQNESQVVNESSHISELVFVSRPSSNASVKEPENLLALTDAWSSTDAADSPRSLRVSEGLLKRALHKPAESSSSQSATSLDLSSTMNESEGQRSPRSDSTEGETLEEQSQTSSDMETNLNSFWSDPNSTVCSTHENNLLHESSGQLSNYNTQCTEEPCTVEKYIYKLYTSASTDIHGKDAYSSNNEVPPESEVLDGCDVNVVNAYSKDREVLPGSSGCSPDKSLCKDMQSSTMNQALLYEGHVVSGSESLFAEKYATQEHFTQFQQGTQCAEKVDAVELASSPSRSINCALKQSEHDASLEVSHCDSASQFPSVIKNDSNQSFITSTEELQHSVMQRSEIHNEFSHESQGRVEHLDNHIEKAVGDGKVLQDQELSDLPLTANCTEIYVTRNTKGCTSKTIMKSENSSEGADVSKHSFVKLDHEAVGVPCKHTGKKSEDSHDVTTNNLKIPKTCCVGTFAPSDSAVVEENEAMKVDSFSTSRDTTGKLSSKEKEMSASSSSACKWADLEQDSTVPSADRNTMNQNCNKCALGPAFTAPEKKKASSYLVNRNDMSMEEVKYDTALVEVTDRGMFDDRKCRKMDPTINEKISEVVKEHLSMSLTVDRGEESNGEPETVSERSPAISMADVNIHEATLEGSQTEPCKSQIFPLVTKSPNDDGRESCCLKGEYCVKCSPMEKETILQHTESGLISNCPSQSVEDCTVDSIVLHSESDNDLDSLNTGYQRGLIDKLVIESYTPSQRTVMSAYIRPSCTCPKVTPSPESVTCPNTAKDKTADHCVLQKLNPTSIQNACDSSFLASTSVRIKSCEVVLPSYLPPVGSNFSEVSDSPKESGVLQVSHPVEYSIASEVHKEVANSESVSEGDMTSEFKQNMEVSTDSKSLMKKENEYSFNPEFCHKSAENFQATDSRPFNKLAHERCSLLERSGKDHISNTQSQRYGEQSTNTSSNIITRDDSDNKPVDLINNTCSGELNKENAISNSSQDLLKSCTSSQPSSDDQTYQITQRVIMNGAYNNFQPEDQSTCGGDHKNHRTSILGQSRDIQGEETPTRAKQLQVLESSICIDSAVGSEEGNQTDRREAHKPDLRSSAASEETRPLNINPKEQKHKPESTEKATGVEDHVRVVGARLNHCSHNDDRQRLKTKKYRRAHFRAPLSSSTDSADSSFDEIPKTRVHHCSAVTRAKPSTTALGRPNIVAQSRAGNVAPDEPHTSLSPVIGPREHHCLGAGSGEEVTTDIAEKESRPRQRQSHLTAEISNSNSLLKDETVSVTRINCSKQISHEHTPERTQLHKTDPMREPTLHFASSDINPFIHARKSDELLKAVNRHQAFGSAVNISSQLSQIEDCDKRITRCCSVDNGLNVQNSPFNSHLSTYANHKGLSSTLSSVEDSKQHISKESQLKEVHHTLVSSDKTLAASSSDSYNDTSDLGHSSGQVDEIVLVYSSEHETQESSRKCDHGTQTIMFDEDLKKRSRHRRSNTQVPVSRQAHETSTTWASLQNMSEHLSELILNTSDLLGNIQCMRTGDRGLKYEHPLKTCSKVLKVHSDKHCKRDGSTQTAVDIGIQTEAPFLMKQSKVTPESPSVQNPKGHEVNVIVKVIGSDVCSDSNQARIKCIRDQYENRQSFEIIKSMPDLRPNTSPLSEQLVRTLEVSASKVLSLETVVPNQNFPDPKTLTNTTVDHAPIRRSSNCFGDAYSKRTSDMLARDNHTHQMRLKPKNCPDKQVLFMDRASSPILTVEVLSHSQNGKAKSAQSSSNHKPTKMHNPTEKQVSRSFKNPLERKQMSTAEIKALASYTYQNERVCENKSVSSVSLENFSDLNCTNGNGSDVYSEIVSLSGRFTQNGGKKFVQGVHMRGVSQPVLRCPLSSCTSSDKHGQHEDSRQNIYQSSTPINQSYRSSMLKHNHRLSQDSVKCWSDLSKSNFQYKEEDVVSLAPSECNTDILVSIDPLIETSPLKEDQWIPEDLPVHNKFTNWSGINQQSPARLSNDCNPRMDKSPESSQPYSAESRHKPQFLEGANRKTREIERLRKEREQVLASVRLDMSPQQLSVELTEAKLHYGLGQTDTLLKMLQSSPREESAISAKQQLYDRHRRSIDGLRKEREARLQNCRRARSLSPSKHPNSSSHETEKSQRPSDLPSRRREYLQQLRQEVVQMSRVPDPPKRGGQCPSDIELLLRDYSRAREEARTEIARARERLRERTEQEKRRLQQQALTQAVKDDLRLHTRFSNSTLCTGSNLSLSSGPTSGYNSSNAALLKDSTSPSIQITGVSEVGLRVKTRPPMIPPQSVKAPRAWLSAQDIRLETSSSGYELLSSSSPSSPPARQRTFSFSSPSSLSTSYQDIADCTLASAISEVHLASGGDLRNLLAGKAAAGWRHQGMERGVQTFHRPSSRPSAHGFLGAVELERPLASLWCLIRDHSKTHFYNESLKSAWTRPLDDSTQLVYLLTDPSNCELKQPRDFCCLSTESRQDDMWVLAMQSVFEESLPRPSVDTIRGEMLPSAWFLQPSQRQGRDVVIVIYLLQVDLGTPSLPQRLLSTVARKQAAVIADLDSFFSFS
ncbi:stAR-related lipid transfer protein 9 isoform X2 [Colossoma macropomum]|uniref:stAR-related lipid transfer protein 9 isoform X2 n=1 Tax=Colossoma macropomum TaxID=42526 RepID=UPI001864CB12|nr:stAR-related lipid transfer protein 9 isoform X2 [Colossoma macropomum]